MMDFKMPKSHGFTEENIRWMLYNRQLSPNLSRGPEKVFTSLAMNNLEANPRIRLSIDHGFTHWRRVFTNFAMLVSMYGLKGYLNEAGVIFAAYHDSKRINEDYDEWHGPRAAQYLKSIGGDKLNECGGRVFSPDMVAAAVTASEHHTTIMPATFEDTIGSVSEDTKWVVALAADADRLDYGRLGLPIDEKMLFTEGAKLVAKILNQIQFGR